MAKTITLYRAANDDIIVGTASFSESLEAARAYLDNPGFGGRTLYRATVEIDPATVLDLTDVRDPMATLIEIAGYDPGAIGPDEWLGRGVDGIDDRYQWARVHESYPADSITWIWLGQTGADDPEMEPVE